MNRAAASPGLMVLTSPLIDIDQNERPLHRSPRLPEQPPHLLILRQPPNRPPCPSTTNPALRLSTARTGRTTATAPIPATGTPSGATSTAGLGAPTADGVLAGTAAATAAAAGFTVADGAATFAGTGAAFAATTAAGFTVADGAATFAGAGAAFGEPSPRVSLWPGEGW